MVFFICIVPVCPLRKEASHQSEMVSQVLLGEIALCLEESALFVKIQCSYDGYEGWCQKTQLLKMDEQRFDNLPPLLAGEWSNQVFLNGNALHISFGSPVSLFSNGPLQMGNQVFDYNGHIQKPAENVFDPASIKFIAQHFLNSAYLWGGRSVFGIDCSGFTQQVYRFFNKPLPRDAYQQATVGEDIGFLQEVKCGDLAFFDNEAGKITHVGLLYSSDTIIHASGKVRIDQIDNMGIINTDTGLRTHKLRVIKRII